MAMFINDQRGEHTWYIGQEIPRGLVGVYTIQADGHELEAIRSRFPALTPEGVRVARFPAPFSQLILWNLGTINLNELPSVNVKQEHRSHITGLTAQETDDMIRGRDIHRKR